MSSDQVWIQDLSEVVDGGRMEVWDEGTLLCAGSVDQVDSAHGVVWIREDGIGERKMVHAQQYDLRYYPTRSCPANRGMST